MRGSHTLVVLSLAAIVLVTMVPVSAADVSPAEWCFLCGQLSGIDFVLNVALFIPLGVSLRVAGVSRLTSALLVIVATTTIELAQLTIPGRISSSGDLVANIVGGGAGYALGGSLRTIVAPASRQAAGFLAAASALVLLIMWGTLWLFEPSPTPHPYWGQFAPELGQFAKFGGTVVDAQVGGESLRNGRLRNTDAVRALLEQDSIVVLASVHGGPPTEALAPAVSIFDGQQQEVMLLGREGTDLVFRVRRRATEMGLRTPTITVWNAFPSNGSDGADAPLQLKGTINGFVIAASSRSATNCESRSIKFRPTNGWAYLLPFEHLYTENGKRFTIIWVALVFSPLGYYALTALVRSRTIRAKLAIVAWTGSVPIVGLVAIPTAFDMAPGTSSEWLSVAIGYGIAAIMGLVAMATVEPHKEVQHR